MLAPVEVGPQRCLVAIVTIVFPCQTFVNKACCLGDIGIYLPVVKYRLDASRMPELPRVPAALVGDSTDSRRVRRPV